MKEREGKIFRVVHILNSESIVINGGLNNGINENTRLLVYKPGEVIFDPETGKSLGELEIPKGYFKVKHSQEQMATLVSEIKTSKYNFTSGLGVAFSKLDSESSPKEIIKLGDYVKIVNRV